MGQDKSPPLIYFPFAALLITWSIACIAKFIVINSQIGLNPYNAAPTAIPANPLSVIGVSITLYYPNFSYIPFDTLYAPN